MENKRKNPWIGLESYKEGDALYGRDDDILNLTQNVLSDNELLLYGKSGIGKSSILNAGVLPVARRKGYLPVIIRLSHKEQESYLRQMERAIENVMMPIPTDKDGKFLMGEEERDERRKELSKRIHEEIACKDQANESLYEFFHRHTFHDANGERLKLLLIFDQFEEIFTLQTDEKRKKAFFSELADLLNDIMPSSLRQNTPEVTPEDEVPKQTTSDNIDDFLDAISFDINDTTPEYIQDNDIHFVFTIREDFLSEFEYFSAAIPSLKHNRYGLRPINEEQAVQIIMRPSPGLVSEEVARLIIEKVTGRTDFILDGIPEIEVDSAVLSLYLNRLYDAKKEECITAELVQQKGGEIISDFYNGAIADVSDSTIEYLEDNLLNGQGRRDNIAVYDAINKGGVTPEELDILCDKKKILRQFNYAGVLRLEYVHDILCPVVIAHRDERTQQKAQQEFMRKAEAESRKARKRLISMLGAVAVLVAVMLGWYVLRFMSYSVDYGSYTTVNGWPVGIGSKVSGKDTKEKLIVYYRLTRKGLLPHKWMGKPFTKVEVINANGERTTNVFVETPVVRTLDAEFNDENACTFAKLMKNTSYWVYTPTDDEYREVAKCTAYGTDDKELYSVQYYRDVTYVSNDKSKYTQWAVFNDANGKQMMVTDNGIDRMRQTMNNGLMDGCVFFTEIGTPQKNVYGAYGYHYEMDGLTTKRQFKVDKYGNKIEDSATEYVEYDKYGRLVKTNSYEVEYAKGMQVYHFPNFKDTLLFNDHGRHIYGTFHTDDGEFDKVVYRYDDSGKPLLNKKYKNHNLAEKREYTYRNASDTLLHVIVIQDSVSYIEKYSYPNDSTTILRLWTADGNPFTKNYVDKMGYNLGFHCRRTTTSNGSLTQSVEFLDSALRPVSDSLYDFAKCVINKEIGSQRIKTVYYYDSQGEICQSEWFDYDEYGSRSSRAVAGVDGTPVRCPQWDKYGVCYYKMFVLYPFNDKQLLNMVSATGQNEFGEPCFIQNDNFCMTIEETPYNYNNTKMDSTSNETVIAIACTEGEWLNGNVALFVHILSKEGTAYHCPSLSGKDDGLRDGDVVLRMGGTAMFPTTNTPTSMKQWAGRELTVARPRPDAGIYDVLRFRLPAGDPRAELHAMSLTEKEFNRLNKCL